MPTSNFNQSWVPVTESTNDKDTIMSDRPYLDSPIRMGTKFHANGVMASSIEESEHSSQMKAPQIEN